MHSAARIGMRAVKDVLDRRRDFGGLLSLDTGD
jgi:hypothetical protein